MRANGALRSANLLVWRSESDRSTLCWVPWSECIPDLVLQSCWLGLLPGHARYELSLLRSTCWPLQASPLFSIAVRFPVVETWILLSPLWWKIRVWAPTMLGGDGCPSWVLFSYWRNWRLRGDLSVWCSAGLGEGQYGHCVVTSSTLLMQSFDLCGAGGTSATPTCSRILSVVSCFLIVVNCACEKEQSGEELMLPPWWCHWPTVLFLCSCRWHKDGKFYFLYFNNFICWKDPSEQIKHKSVATTVVKS